MNRTAARISSFVLLASAAAAQWSAPTLLANVNSTSGDYGPSPTSDGLTLYLASSRTGGVGNYDLYRATRTTPYGNFGLATLIPELCSVNHDGDPCVRRDNLEIFFFSDRAGAAASYDIWRADRASTSVQFNPPVPVTELNTSSWDLSPSLTQDGLRIYFYSNRSGGSGGYDIWTATRPAWGAPFGAPAPVAELNTPQDDRDPHVSPDGLVMFFASSRPGTLGQDDIWMASRLDPTVPFSNIVNLTVLNSTVYDQSPSFGAFPDELFFTSSRPGGFGGYELYRARFTGITAAGIAGLSSTQSLRFSDPSSPGRLYFAASSLQSSPGIPIDSRVVPLRFDLLFQLSIGGLPPVLNGYVGTLDPNGVAAGGISFAGFPQLVGLRFFTAFLVLDAGAPSGVRTISNAHEVLVQ